VDKKEAYIQCLDLYDYAGAETVIFKITKIDKGKIK